MYNQFTEQELEFILKKLPITKDQNLKNIRTKIEDELYADEDFVGYIANKDNEILKIYKYKGEAKYTIIVKESSTRRTYQIIKLCHEYEMENDKMYEIMVFEDDEDYFVDSNNQELIFEKGDKNG